MGQFFTPDPLAALMWSIIRPAMDIVPSERVISILDNSIGSGRLLQFAVPGRHALYGVDVDTDVAAALGEAAQAAGFMHEFETCGMESIRPAHFDVGLINPPFSLHMESPLLNTEYPCLSYGKYGPNSSTLSHAYALAQIVDSCQIAVALLPSTFADEVVAHPEEYLKYGDEKRLRAHIELPSGLFRLEGTDVSVALLVFAASSCSKPLRLRLQGLDDPLPDFGLKLGEARIPKLKVIGITDDGPAITKPVTGSTVVRVAHTGRKIVLGFDCGLTQAKVLNGIYRTRVVEDGPVEYRRPKGFKYAGQGALDIEVHLAQEDTDASFESLLKLIRMSGGAPVVHPGVTNYLRKCKKKLIRQITPFRHSVLVPEGVAGDHDKVIGRARKKRIADPKVWGSPVIDVGQTVAFHRQESGLYSYEVMGRHFSIKSEDLYQDFDIESGAADAGWQVVHKGLIERFPDIANNIESRAKALGIDQWLTWGFQWYDLIETMMKPSCIIAWEMSLGKARLAVALITLAGCKHGLLTVEAGLIEEMLIELRGLPIPEEDWQVITQPEHLKHLRRINVVSYERLRMPIRGGGPRDTYAKRLRRRIGLLVSDEGDLLANPDSDQSRALWHVSAKRRFVLSGTPLANYPRDILPTMAFSCGDGTAAQPWGWRRGYLEQNWRQSISYAERGIDAFRKKFVVLEWVTNQFADTLIEGAKREVPKIANLHEYRAMIAPHVKRRLVNEPEVQRHIHIPPETRSVVEVPWDRAHLAYYLKVADEFSQWYVKQKGDKANNLIAILARIRAVSFASDFPQHPVEGFVPYGALTSKQRWVINEVERLTAQGRKTIVYAENPLNLELIGQHLSGRGVDSVLFHGKKPIRVRTSELDKRFRFGDCPNLLASLGVTQKGLNLPQGNEILLLSRSWSATVEEQAIRRTLRPQQKANVRVRYVHLPGGIDIYKEQMVCFKKDCSDAGLDWGTPQKASEEFLHIDTVLERFVQGLADMHKMSRGDFREYLKEGVANAA